MRLKRRTVAPHDEWRKLSVQSDASTIRWFIKRRIGDLPFLFPRSSLCRKDDRLTFRKKIGIDLCLRGAPECLNCYKPLRYVRRWKSEEGDNSWCDGRRSMHEDLGRRDDGESVD